MPLKGTNLLLFSNPSPGLSTMISPKISFLSTLWNLCVPSAKPVMFMRFDKVKASFLLFANLIVVAFILYTK